MSDEQRRPTDLEQTGERVIEPEPIVSDDLLVDDITTVRSSDPAEGPVGDRTVGDPLDAGVWKAPAGAVDHERTVEADDLIGVRESPGRQITDAHVSSDDVDPSPDGEPGEADESPDEDVDVDEPATSNMPTEPKGTDIDDGPEVSAIVKFEDGEVSILGVRVWSDGVVAQTDEDGIPIDDGGPLDLDIM